MKNAPVIIPTLCRYEQLKGCIISLQKNKYAMGTELFIGLDYPARESHWAGYKQIKEYLKSGLDGFLNIHLIEHKKNMGWYQNYNILRNEVYKKYDCYIYTEDDNIFSPNFLEYMNKNLVRYQDDDRILAISGYSYPIGWGSNNTESNTLKLNTYFSAWGYGIWKAKEKLMLQFLTMNNFDKLMRNSSYMYKLRLLAKNQYCNFIKGMVEYTDMLVCDNEIMSIDLSYGLYMLFKNKYMIFPIISKVRNMGHGAGGLNCKDIVFDTTIDVDHRNYIYADQEIDYGESYGLSGDALDVNEEIQQNMDSFFAVSQKEYFRCNCTLVLYKIFGRKNMVKIINKLKH